MSVEFDTDIVDWPEVPVAVFFIRSKVFSILVSVIFQSAIFALVVIKVGVPAEAFETICVVSPVDVLVELES